ncbi:MAG: peptide chain release factor-like protein [Pirellulaceae bacterium]
MNASGEQTPHPCELAVESLERECSIRFGRRSGPGGQHRNKVETAVILTHQPTGVSAEASERRSQAANRGMALQRLRVNLALAIRTSRGGSSPTDRWTSHRHGQRLAVSSRHEDFPALLAEALDVLAEQQDELPAAAERLGVSGSQLVRLLKLEPRALDALNQRRQARGQHRLR